VAHNGTETPLEIAHEERPGVSNPQPKIKDIQVTTVNEANSLVKVEMKDSPSATQRPPLIMFIGGQVFGYSDAPIHREGNFLSAVAPDALLIAHPSVTVTALFAPSDFRDSFRVTAFDALS
jgi:hypothetical protein